MYKCVIFDLDGTLLNTIEDITDSLNYALSNSNFRTFSSNDVKMFVGSGVNVMIKRALVNESYDSNQFDKVKEDYMSFYKENQRNKTCPYSGVLDFL